MTAAPFDPGPWMALPSLGGARRCVVMLRDLDKQATLTVAGEKRSWVWRVELGELVAKGEAKSRELAQEAALAAAGDFHDRLRGARPPLPELPPDPSFVVRPWDVSGGYAMTAARREGDGTDITLHIERAGHVWRWRAVGITGKVDGVADTLDEARAAAEHGARRLRGSRD